MTIDQEDPRDEIQSLGCAFEDCGREACPVCSVPRRFPKRSHVDEDGTSGRPALNGIKPSKRKAG